MLDFIIDLDFNLLITESEVSLDFFSSESIWILNCLYNIFTYLLNNESRHHLLGELLKKD